MVRQMAGEDINAQPELSDDQVDRVATEEDLNMLIGRWMSLVACEPLRRTLLSAARISLARIAAHGLALLASTVAMAAAAAPSAPTVCLAGVWSGSVGATPITMSLTPGVAGGPASGTYYYRAALSDLVLLPEKQLGYWREIAAKGQITGRLHLTCDDRTLEGRWTPVNGGRPLRIRARRIADDQYHAAREAGLRPIAALYQEGVGQYETLALPVPDADGEVFKEYGQHIRGIRLLGTAPGLRKINETLRTQWLGWLREHLDCVAYGRIERSPDAAFHTSGSQSVLVWTSDQVVISVATDAYCGGNHPMTWQEVLIYRPTTGEPVEAGAWIADSMDRPLADQAEDTDQGPGLRQLLDQAYEPDNGNPDCKDSIRWSVLFARPGEVAFRAEASSYGMRMCNGEYFLPLEQVWRFLSPDGQRDLAAFRLAPGAAAR